MQKHLHLSPKKWKVFSKMLSIIMGFLSSYISLELWNPYTNRHSRWPSFWRINHWHPPFKNWSKVPKSKALLVTWKFDMYCFHRSNRKQLLGRKYGWVYPLRNNPCVLLTHPSISLKVPTFLHPAREEFCSLYLPINLAIRFGQDPRSETHVLLFSLSTLYQPVR